MSCPNPRSKKLFMSLKDYPHLCAVAHIVAGKVIAGGNVNMQTGDDLWELQLGENYGYLGVSQVFAIKANETKDRIKKEYYSRVKTI